MKKQYPTSTDIRTALLEPGFDASAAVDVLPLSDPVTITQMRVPVNRIKPCDRNPRSLPNRRFAETKENIRKQKRLISPFNITRRPGESLYMVEAGGNTRLEILQELHHETGDEAFFWVPCLYVPWQSETSLISNHLVENELRDPLVLIDKAYAIREWRVELEKEQGNSISQREFVKLVGAQGYQTSRRELARLDYLLELDQLIPVTLRHEGGISATQLDKIKRTCKAYKQYCNDKTTQFDPLFANIMVALDGEDWHFDTLRDELDRQLSTLLDVPVNRLRLQVDAIFYQAENPESSLTQRDYDNLLKGNESEPSEGKTGNKEQDLALLVFPEQAQDSEALEAITEIEGSDPGGGPTEAEFLRANEGGCSDNAGKKTTESKRAKETRTLIKEAPDEPASSEGKDPGKLYQMRNAAFETAEVLAENYSMGKLVISRNLGFGFVIDVPDQPLPDVAHFGCWWFLAGLSRQHEDGREGLLQDTKAQPLISSEQGLLALDPFVALPMSFINMAEYLNTPEYMDDKHFRNAIKLIQITRNISELFPKITVWNNP